MTLLFIASALDTQAGSCAGNAGPAAGQRQEVVSMTRQVRIPIRLLAAASALVLAGGVLGSGLVASAAAPAVGLGTAGAFSVVAGSGITNTGSSVINGNIGSYPTTTITGFPPGLVNGTNHAGDAVTQSAKTDLVTAYNDAAGRTPVTTVPTELGGTTLVPGVYGSAAGTFGITGTVTLNGQGDPNAVFIFKTNSTLVTATGSTVSLIGGAQSCNVFWQVGSSATLGGSTSFKGTILALTSITLVTGASIDGRALARNGAVTLDTNTITASPCAAAPSVAPATATPVPTASATPIATPAPTATPSAVPTATPVIIAPVAPTATPTPSLVTLPSTSTSDRDGTPMWIVLVMLGAFALLTVRVVTGRVSDRRTN